MNRSAIGLSMVTINLDCFSFRFAKFAKLSPRQTFPLYGMYYIHTSKFKKLLKGVGIERYTQFTTVTLIIKKYLNKMSK